MTDPTVESMHHLDELESEAIFVIREGVAQFRRPCLLFSGGKDSAVLAHLVRAAYHPAPIPFPFVHIDTGHNFPETMEFRDRTVSALGVHLIIGSVQESIDRGRVAEDQTASDRNALQSVTLLDTILAHGFDAAFGGARRDEEKARAKERFFSHRDASGKWSPENQRPELWNLFNGRHSPGEHFRIFPISNWTEADVWNYIRCRGIALPALYFAHERPVVWRNGSWVPVSPWIRLGPDERPEVRKVRFRTCGDITISGALESKAVDAEAVIRELRTLSRDERGGRLDDRKSETAMEDRKRSGYF